MCLTVPSRSWLALRRGNRGVVLPTVEIGLLQSLQRTKRRWLRRGFDEDVPPRKGLQGVLDLEAKTGTCGGSSPSGDPQAAHKEKADAPDQATGSSNAAIGEAVGGGSVTRVGSAKGVSIAFVDAARSIGEAFLFLDEISLARLNDLALSRVDPGKEEAVMPVMASAGLAPKLSDAFDKCSVELLKKGIGYNAEAGTSRDAPAGVVRTDADGRVGHDS